MVSDWVLLLEVTYDLLSANGRSSPPPYCKKHVFRHYIHARGHPFVSTDYSILR